MPGSTREKRLRPDEFVISADEKTSIYARCRCHPTLPRGVAWAMRVEHEYEQGGSLDYIVAWDCHRATILGRCVESTTIKSFDRWSIRL